MASVYYLLDDAIHVADYIVETYSQQDKNLKEKHHAATVIQRTWRLYVAKVAYTKTVHAAIVLQKYIRGWRARFHLPDAYEEYFDKISLEKYNSAATVIQKVWKGVLVRLEINIKELVAEKRRQYVTGYNVSMLFDDKALIETKENKQEAEVDSKDGETGPGGQEMIYMNSIIEMMFDRHHLLSTKLHKGVLGANEELQEVEKFLSKLSWSKYMKTMKKMYYKYKKYERCERPQYMFKSWRMRHEEDVRRLRDTRNDLKEEDLRNCVVDKRKPFSLYLKKTQLSYEQSIMSDGRYVKPIRNVTRTDDPSKNICEKDFYLSLKDIGDKCDILPYYIDFWYKECTGHYYKQ